MFADLKSYVFLCVLDCVLALVAKSLKTTVSIETQSKFVWCGRC